MIRTYSRAKVYAVAAALLCGCASASQHAYVAPTQETIFTSIEEMTTGPGNIIYVTNRSSVRVTIYSFTLRECQNVKGQCSPRVLDLHVDPGSRAQMARVEPSNPQSAFNFRYSFGWRADSSTTAALGALASAGDTRAQQQLDAIRRADARQRHEVGAQDLELTTAELASYAGRIGSLRPVPDSLVLSVGARVPLDTVRMLVIGTNNETLGRIRALQWRVASGAVTMVQPDTLVARSPGRSSLQLKLPDDVLPDQSALHAVIQVPIVVRP